MTATIPVTEPLLQQVLWACLDSHNQRDPSAERRLLCYYWLIGPYEKRFGTKFSQGTLRRLASMGFLKPEYTVRGGNRRYYTLVDPELVAELVREWQVN